MEFLQWFNRFLTVATFAVVNLVVEIAALAFLSFLQKRSPNKGLTLFSYAFISGILSNIIHIVMAAVESWLIFSYPLTVLQIIYVIRSGISMLFGILFALLLSLGLIHLLGYEGKMNSWAMIGGALVIVSMYVPWCQIGPNLIAPTYTIPSAVYTSDVVTLLHLVALLLLLIPAYLSFIGSVFSGSVGYAMIIVSGVLTLIAPFTFLGMIGIASPWIGIPIPFIAAIILFYALSVHPKELQKSTQET